LSFNDDIQGTGAVTLSVLITAMKIKEENFRDQNYVIVGMGQAGSGIANNIFAMLMSEGLTEDEAKRRIFAVDVKGLIMSDMDGLEPQMLKFAKNRSDLDGWDLDNHNKIVLKDVVKNSKATVLIGVTAQPGYFDAEIIGNMCRNTERPVILALSNPSSKCECHPKDVIEISHGKVLMAFGSPFKNVESQYGNFSYSQCNNMYIFPGIGLGALISKTPKITFDMFLAGSMELSKMVTPEQMKSGLLLPQLNDIRNVSFRVAYAVAKVAREKGLGRLISDEQLEITIKKAQWDPDYLPFRPAIPHGSPEVSGWFE
jgi:malate dehydrogenase (oxaloacetate-decarboxylating)